MFGDGFLKEIRHRVYTADIGSEVYKAAFIPSRNEIWLNSKVQAEPLTILHEATHYYQKNRLGRDMSTRRTYYLASKFVERMDVEQEAMLVMAYAATIDPSLRGHDDHPLPPLEETIRYLRTYMDLDLACPASER